MMAPFILLTVGLSLLFGVLNGDLPALETQARTDLVGFSKIAIIVFILGLLGLSSSIRPVSKAGLVLVVIVYIVATGNQILTGLKNLSGTQ